MGFVEFIKKVFEPYHDPPYRETTGPGITKTRKTKEYKQGNKFNTLKGVAHNLAAFYFGSYNYQSNDLMENHFYKVVKRTGISEIEIDVLNGKIAPEQFSTPAILNSVTGLQNKFDVLLQSEGLSMEKISSARMYVKFIYDRDISDKGQMQKGFLNSRVEIIAVNGRKYNGEIMDLFTA